LVWQDSRELKLQAFGGAIEPQVRSNEGGKEYVWDLRDVPASLIEDQVPSWYPAYPCVQASSYTNWADVASWASTLFVTTNLQAAELSDLIARLQQPGGPAEENVQRALDFTQHDIRYLGIEFDH
jgi:hypothetical protein